MKIENKHIFRMALGFLAAFMLWTAAICLIDVQAIGPLESTVGFATLNHFFHSLTGVHMALYTITDRLSLIPLASVLAFAALGLTQWIQRKKLSKVDHSILLLGSFYVVVMILYALFEFVIVNYRPVLINGILEASYPSSTTMLVLTVMPTTIMQLNTRIKTPAHKQWVLWTNTVFSAFMVIGRLVSGVHWLTDIIGGALLSTGLVLLYTSFLNQIPE